MAFDGRFHVLAVDDSVIDRMLIQKLLLKTNSFHVTVADSGIKALELLGLLHDNEDEGSTSVLPEPADNQQYHHHPHADVNLIITDYQMPGMTGYDLLKKIKKSENLKDIPVIIMSSENIPSRISRCLEDGAEEFFLKPVRLSDIVEKLQPRLFKCKSHGSEHT